MQSKYEPVNENLNSIRIVHARFLKYINSTTPFSIFEVPKSMITLALTEGFWLQQNPLLTQTYFFQNNFFAFNIEYELQGRFFKSRLNVLSFFGRQFQVVIQLVFFHHFLSLFSWYFTVVPQIYFISDKNYSSLIMWNIPHSLYVSWNILITLSICYIKYYQNKSCTILMNVYFRRKFFVILWNLYCPEQS